MPNDKSVYYWDSSVLLAWIKDEKRPPGEIGGVCEIAEKIHGNEAILITSVVTQTEWLQCTLPQTAQDALDRFFKRRNVRLINVDSRIAKLAQEIRNHYQQEKRRQIDPHPTVSQADAVHLATVILYEATEFHTFDDGGKDGRSLLDLDGNVAGHSLKICKPIARQQRFPW